MKEGDFIQELFQRNRKCLSHFPDKELVENFMDELFSFLFASYQEKYKTEMALAGHYANLKNTFAAILFELLKNEVLVKENADIFFKELPEIYQQLLQDAQATLDFDPAAKSLEEVLIAYPGFYATSVYRIAHQLHLQEIQTLPRLLSEYAHSKTGIDIHPGATIGQSFTIDHGTGIVVGETANIGNNVKLYQGVTLGALNVDKSMASNKRHPTIEDNVVIYSGATILGGKTIIGHDSIIGGNVWLTSSVESFSIVYHKSEVRVREKFDFSEVLNFVI
ncbi:serine O-acetyltransferase [Parasediminibacterium sp. JCM 36343]|uniref:serine O-acetyltransferase n=1 Tax=Parasediminibacterium sp. JCM 36343 TaxID=3374279 RepID=UPI00397CC0C5